MLRQSSFPIRARISLAQFSFMAQNDGSSLANPINSVNTSSRRFLDESALVN